jgi:hypothetical protein
MPIPNRTTNADYHFHAYSFAPPGAPWTLSPAVVPRNGWQFYSMAQDLQGLLATGLGTVPNIALTNVGGLSIGGRQTKALSFGSNDPNAPAVVITGGIHAREWIAVEFVYLLAEYLILHYALAPANPYQQAIKDLVDSRRIHIIPMLNPDGNMETVFGADRLWRKNRHVLPVTGAGWLLDVAPLGVTNLPFANAHLGPLPAANAIYDVPDYDAPNQIPPNAAHYRTRPLANGAAGVDLNRNVPTTAWGYECLPNSVLRANYIPSSPSYFGPGAGSETETGNLQLALAGAANPQIATSIDYHAYGKLILYPTEAFDNNEIGPDYFSLGRTLQQLIRAQGAIVPDYQLGSPFALIGYNATGTVIDREARQYHGRAFTIELDPGVHDDPPGFQLPETDIRRVFEKNIRGALAAIAAPGTPGNWFTAQLQRAAIAWAEHQFFGWNVYGRGNRLPA